MAKTARRIPTTASTMPTMRPCGKCCWAGAVESESAHRNQHKQLSFFSTAGSHSLAHNKQQEHYPFCRHTSSHSPLLAQDLWHGAVTLKANVMCTSDPACTVLAFFSTRPFKGAL